MNKDAYITNIGTDNDKILGIECVLKQEKSKSNNEFKYHINVVDDFISCGAVGCTFLANQISPSLKKKILVKFEKGYNVSNSPLTLSKMFDIVRKVNKNTINILPEVYGLSLALPNTPIYNMLSQYLSEICSLNKKYSDISRQFLYFVNTKNPADRDEQNIPLMNNPLYFIAMEYIENSITWLEVFNEIELKLVGDIEKGVEFILKNNNHYELVKDFSIKIDKLHEMGVIHGDLHGGNILCLPDNTIRLIDFGRFSENKIVSWKDEENQHGLWKILKYWYDVFKLANLRGVDYTTIDVGKDWKLDDKISEKSKYDKDYLYPLSIRVRSDIFERKVSKGIKELNKQVYDVFGTQPRTDCGAMVLASLGWPKSKIKVYQEYAMKYASTDKDNIKITISSDLNINNNLAWINYESPDDNLHTTLDKVGNDHILLDIMKKIPPLSGVPCIIMYSKQTAIHMNNFQLNRYLKYLEKGFKINGSPWFSNGMNKPQVEFNKLDEPWPVVGGHFIMLGRSDYNHLTKDDINTFYFIDIQSYKGAEYTIYNGVDIIKGLNNYSKLSILVSYSKQITESIPYFWEKGTPYPSTMGIVKESNSYNREVLTDNNYYEYFTGKLKKKISKRSSKKKKKSKGKKRKPSRTRRR